MDDVVSLQLEESCKTLTKDVEGLAKEKAELSEKLGTQEEGMYYYIYFFSITYRVLSIL